MLVWSSVSACATSAGQHMMTYRWEGPAFLFLAVCQGLSLLLLSSNACNSDVLIGLGGPATDILTFGETCEMSTGAKFVISATAFWAAAGVVSFMAHRTEKIEMAEGVEDTFLSEPLTA